MPNISRLRLGASSWRTGYLNQTAGGLALIHAGSSLEFAFGAAGAGAGPHQQAELYNGADYYPYLVGTAGPWDFSSGELVWHNAAWPDWTTVAGGAVSSGSIAFGVVLYNLVDTDQGNWEVDWGVQVQVASGVVTSAHADAFLLDATGGRRSLIDPAINGGGSFSEHIGGLTGPTLIPTPVELYTWVRLRSVGGLIFYETSRDGTTWAFVHGSAGSAPDLGGDSMPMSDLLRAGLSTVGVQFYASRTPGYGSGSWIVDHVNTAPYPTGGGDPTADTVWVAYGFDAAGQTGRGEFGPTGTYLGADEPLPGPVLFPRDVDIVQLATGANQSAGVSADGHLYVWGDCFVDTDQGFFGDQLVPPFTDFDPTLGDPPLSQRAVAVPTLLAYDDATTVVQCAVGNSALFWLKADHTVWGVGTNLNGEFGTASSGEYFGSPVQLAVGTDVAWIAACLGRPGLFCVGTDGLAYFAGNDFYAMSGRLNAPTFAGGPATGAGGPTWPDGYGGGADPGPDTSQLTFLAVPGVAGITQLSVDGQTALAIAAQGTLYIWGWDLSAAAVPAPLSLGGMSNLALPPVALQGGGGSIISQPFVTVSSPSGGAVGSGVAVPGHWAAANTSLTATGAVTIEPPLPTPP